MAKLHKCIISVWENCIDDSQTGLLKRLTLSMDLIFKNWACGFNLFPVAIKKFLIQQILKRQCVKWMELRFLFMPLFKYISRCNCKGHTRWRLLQENVMRCWHGKLPWIHQLLLSHFVISVLSISFTTQLLF